jgi:transposase
MVRYYTTLAEVAEHFGVSLSTIYRWLKKDPTFPLIRTATNGYLARPEELDRWAKGLPLSANREG